MAARVLQFLALSSTAAAALSNASSSVDPPLPELGGDTTLTAKLNHAISPSPDKRKLFRGGGTGVLLRVPDYLSLRSGGDLGSPLSAVNLNATSTVVVPATFLHNDIHSPSIMYPDMGGGGANPMCPNNGWTGFGHVGACAADPATRETGPWNFAQLGYVVADAMSELIPHFDQIQDDTYGYGVFYATDSNSVDQRCRYAEAYNGWDCPGYWINSDGSVVQDASKQGAGGYTVGNPTAGGGGGGAGCHFGAYSPFDGIDQTDAYDSQGRNLVQDRHCQCNYDLKTGKSPWMDWVNDWLYHAQPKSSHKEQGWFGGGKAPSFALDFAACWQNNPTDMIGLQNAIWYRRYDWSNQLIPNSNWGREPQSYRNYWGWNEVPVARAVMDNAKKWDAIVIKLPVAICGGTGKDDVLSCLSQGAQSNLEAALDQFVTKGLIVPGADHAASRPGSSVVILKEQANEGMFLTFFRYFFCASWTSPSGKWEIVFSPQTDGCYVVRH